LAPLFFLLILSLSCRAPLLSSLLALIELPEETPKIDESQVESLEINPLAAASADGVSDTLNADEFQAAYVRLAFSNKMEVDPLPQIANVRVFLASALLNLSRLVPRQIPSIIQRLPDQAKQCLAGYFALANLNIASLE